MFRRIITIFASHFHRKRVTHAKYIRDSLMYETRVLSNLKRRNGRTELVVVDDSFPSLVKRVKQKLVVMLMQKKYWKEFGREKMHKKEHHVISSPLFLVLTKHGRLSTEKFVNSNPITWPNLSTFATRLAGLQSL
ncbi:hypothetical protein CEXT_446801 [Caerostris extrusa]|uniref:Uncharacterized protein n=1 Tax=Caerostris extrusa TaxID=172846 RepID=A0AAV4SXE2_CAEEX|nr:hypothetical protein CEXT_446801 [Caerostris extrusa]